MSRRMLEAPAQSMARAAVVTMDDDVSKDKDGGRLG